MVAATRPRRGRRGERGAAVFIVVMVIALLTAIGIFAARSASMVDSASGYDRQASQAYYLAELGGRSAAVEFGGQGKPEMYLKLMMNGTEKCPSNEKLQPVATDAPIYCYKLDTNDLQERALASSGHTLIDKQEAATAGSLGPPLGTAVTTGGLEGAFLVEMIEPVQSEPVAGSDVTGGPTSMRNVQVTLTAFAQVHNVPTSPGANPWCTADTSSAGASVQALRAHVTLPNVPPIIR